MRLTGIHLRVRVHAFLRTSIVALLCLATGLGLGNSSGNRVSAELTPHAGLAASADPPVPPFQTFIPWMTRSFPPPVTVFGVQMYESLDSPRAALPLAQAGKVSWVRLPIYWEFIEPANTTPDQYNFAGLDRSLLAASQAGIHVVGTITGNPKWAARYSSGPIDRADVGELAEFLRALAERYDGDGQDDAAGAPIVSDWELYNEPDGGNVIQAELGHGYWGRYGAQYAEMLCVVYPAIKKANPRARVVMGGIAYDFFEEDYGPFVRSFLDDVLAAGGGRCIDVFNFHYYPFFESRWTPYGPGLTGKANYLKDKLASYGLGNMPTVVTEAGFHSNAHPNQPSTPEKQVAYVVKLFVQSLASGLKYMIWWTWSDLWNYWGANGLLTQDLQPKPAYYAYQTAATKLGTAVFHRQLSDHELGGPGVQGYLFRAPHPLYVLWSDTGETRTVSLPAASGTVTDPFGKPLAQVGDGHDGKVNGWLSVEVGAMPIYVEITP